jgi:DNA repair exonuclease SbcCD ATPase subunit
MQSPRIIAADLFLRTVMQRTLEHSKEAATKNEESHIDIQQFVEETRLSLEQVRAIIMECGATIEDLSGKWEDTFGDLEAVCNVRKHPKHTNRNCLHCMVCMEPFPNTHDEASQTTLWHLAVVIINAPLFILAMINYHVPCDLIAWDH